MKSQTSNLDFVYASMFGVAAAVVLFAVWAPHDAAYEARAVLALLNHLI